MTRKEYKEFMKRYEKFRKNNLPTLFWDKERQTWEYVYKEMYTNNIKRRFYSNMNKEDEGLYNWNIQSSLIESLGDIAFTGFYYSFTDKHIETCFKDKERVEKVVIGHSHAHSFEEVVCALYSSPESFKISEDEEKYYSKQELDYLKKVQKYLLFIGLKDIESHRVPVSRYRNSRQKKYGNCYINIWEDSVINDIINGKRDFVVGEYNEYYKEYGPHVWEPNEFRWLIADKDYNFRLFVDFVKEEICEYSKIKDIVKLDKFKDTDKVVLTYIKVLEVF